MEGAKRPRSSESPDASLTVATDQSVLSCSTVGASATAVLPKHEEDEIFLNAKQSYIDKSMASPLIEYSDSEKSAEGEQSVQGSGVDSTAKVAALPTGREESIYSDTDPSETKPLARAQSFDDDNSNDRRPYYATFLDAQPERVHPSFYGKIGAVTPFGKLGKQIVSFLIHCRDSSKTTAYLKYLRVDSDQRFVEPRWFDETDLIMFRWGVRDLSTPTAKSLQFLCQKHQIPHVYVTRSFFDLFKQKDKTKKNVNIDAMALVNLSLEDKYFSTIQTLMELAWKTALLDFPYFVDHEVLNMSSDVWVPVDICAIFACEQGNAWMMESWIPPIQVPNKWMQSMSQILDEYFTEILLAGKFLLLAVTALDESIWRLAKLCQEYRVRVLFVPDEASVGSVAGIAPTSAAIRLKRKANQARLEAAITRFTDQSKALRKEKSGAVSDGGQITRHEEGADGTRMESPTPAAISEGDTRKGEPSMDGPPLKKQRTTDTPQLSTFPSLQSDYEFGPSSVATKATETILSDGKSARAVGYAIDGAAPKQHLPSSTRKLESTSDHFDATHLKLLTALPENQQLFIPHLQNMRNGDELRHFLKTASQKVLATDKDDASGCQRRELMRRCILDIRIMQSKSDRVVPTAASKEVDETFVDEETPLCPDELVGECCNPSCKYQHLESHFERRAQQERLPLPAVDLSSRIEGSPFNRIDDSVRQWFDKTSNLRKYKTSAFGDGSRPIVRIIEAMCCCKIQSSAKDMTTVSFLLDVQSIEAIGWCKFVGYVLDCVRVAVHAGRADISSALCSCANSLCHNLVSTKKHLDGPYAEQCGRVMKIIEREAREAFCLSQSANANIFELAFDRQLFLVAAAAYLEKLCLASSGSRNSTTSTNAWHDAWSDGEELLSYFTSETCEDCEMTLTEIISGKTFLDKLIGCRNQVLVSTELDTVLSVFSIVSTVQLARGLKHCLVKESANPVTTQDVVGSLSKECRKAVDLGLELSASPAILQDLLLRIVVLSSYTLLGVLESIANQLGSEDSIGRATKQLTVVYNDVDKFLVWLLGFANSVPFMELMLAPVFAANLALGATIQLYGGVQDRLESLLSPSSTEVLGLEKTFSFIQYSEMLWSELLQLRGLLPIPSRAAVYKAELPEDVKLSHEVVVSAVARRNVWPRHCSLANDQTPSTAEK